MGGLLQRLRGKDRDAALDRLLEQAGLLADSKADDRAAALLSLAGAQARLAAELPQFDRNVDGTAADQAKLFAAWERAAAASSAAERERSAFLWQVNRAIDEAKTVLARTADRRIDDLRQTFMTEWAELRDHIQRTPGWSGTASPAAFGLEEQSFKDRMEALLRAFVDSEQLLYLETADQVDREFERLRASLPALRPAKIVKPVKSQPRADLEDA